MFELCPRDADIDRFRFCRENLSPRRRDVGNRGSAGVILILRYVQSLLVSHDRLVEQHLQRIRRAQIVIGSGEERLG